MSDTSGLSIGVDGFTFPIDAAVARFVTLGKSGAGKTNGDAVLIEEFVRIGVPTIVMDPLGTMWGLRSSADGNGPGLSIAIFGGTHGDLPLPAHRAAYLADFVSEGISAVFDMSLMAPEEHLEFAKEFLPRLLQRAKVNMHVNLQEADRFAPNRAVSSPVTMFARASRNAGIGWSFSTQKPQVLHKEVIDSANAFFAMKMTGELAQEAIGGEIGSRIGKKAAIRMMTELPSFKRGEAWFVPDADWLGADAEEWEAQKMRFRLRDTFEVKPPKVGEARREQITLATVDLDKLRHALADTIDVDAAAPADELVIEPLRKRIKDLEDEVAMHKQKLARAVDFVCSSAEKIAREQLERVLAIRSQIPVPPEWSAPAMAKSSTAIEMVAAPIDGELVELPRSALASSVGFPTIRVVDPGIALNSMQQKIVEALVARFPLKTTLAQVGALARYSPSGGAFRTAVKVLRDNGIVDVFGNDIAFTEAGRQRFDLTKKAKPKAGQLREILRGAMNGMERKIFDLIVERGAMFVREIGAATGYAPTGGAFRTALKTLRDNECIRQSGDRIDLEESLR